MKLVQASNDEQAALWNGPAGRAWVEAQDVLDEMFRPLEALLVEGISGAHGARLLDVGCGTGGTTLAAARRLGADACCTGIDISRPMIAAARERAARAGIPARFVCDDAQTYAFAPADFDLIISRFGLMFFADPVAAFANLRRAAAGQAALRFIAWRDPAENPFMTTAERAAAPLLPGLPPRQPDAPGQFAFADAERVRRILRQSGWSSIEIHPFDIACTFAEKDLLAYLSRRGPVGQYLDGADAQTRERVIAAIRPAFEPYVHGAEVRFVAACWLVDARASDAALPTSS